MTEPDVTSQGPGRHDRWVLLHAFEVVMAVVGPALLWAGLALLHVLASSEALETAGFCWSVSLALAGASTAASVAMLVQFAGSGRHQPLGSAARTAYLLTQTFALAIAILIGWFLGRGALKPGFDCGDALGELVACLFLSGMMALSWRRQLEARERAMSRGIGAVHPVGGFAWADVTHVPDALESCSRDLGLEAELEQLGFTRLGVYWVGLPVEAGNPFTGADGEAYEAIKRDGEFTTAYRSSTDDAFAIPEHSLGARQLKFLTLLPSGTIVETRLVPAREPEGAVPIRELVKDLPRSGLRVRLEEVGGAAALWAAHREHLDARAGSERPVRHDSMDLCIALAARCLLVLHRSRGFFGRRVKPVPAERMLEVYAGIKGSSSAPIA